ncbi:negative control protein of sporulation [Xenorhabdus sp. SF857]|uniref:negative control protein of sporulation n=1 Tax=Xenorhabdus bakwenae TaxID=3026967 RepID=UPI002557EFA2|nr:negative control protein of sporulation [Xenorhabdus sp. SF857]WFQ80603.1 negative control protein of sporulation [Xenorhabdus sp. SF857]WFQ80613.1 negative control protein of sporulation [Xenorhabdus sp. SF857]
MLNIPIALCIYTDTTQTRYDVDTGFKANEAYEILKTAYIVGMRNKKKKLIAAGIFISSIEDKTDPKLSDVALMMFEKHKPTEKIIKEMRSMPISRLRFNLANGTVQQAFSEREIDILFTEFYMKNSIGGTA